MKNDLLRELRRAEKRLTQGERDAINERIEPIIHASINKKCNFIALIRAAYILGAVDGKTLKKETK